MIEDVLRAVARAVHAAYPDMPVYLEDVKQGLEAPCFCICCKKPVMERFMGARWRCSLPVKLYCFPGSDNQQLFLGKVMERLFCILELIDCHGAMRGSNMHAGESDGVGFFCVDYGFFCEWKADAPEGGPDVMLALRLAE